MAAFAVLAMMSVTSVSCEKPEESGTKEPAEQPVIELVSPSDGDEVELQEIESIVFEWKAVEGVNAYKVLVSRNRDMSDSREINAVRNPLSLDVKDFDKVLDGFGVKKGTAARIYWTVVAWGREEEFGTQTRKMTVKRLPEGPAQSDEERIADPLTIKVAVLYEDPVMPGTDKYMHEVCTVGGR
ncbi:MAG: SusE domain-containing protein, partial [Bacteroidales bacterium]|nr:SusE domain-containing protein [Bacteroidales bacterium]